jgi:hypothetical protein
MGRALLALVSSAVLFGCASVERHACTPGERSTVSEAIYFGLAKRAFGPSSRNTRRGSRRKRCFGCGSTYARRSNNNLTPGDKMNGVHHIAEIKPVDSAFASPNTRRHEPTTTSSIFPRDRGPVADSASSGRDLGGISAGHRREDSDERDNHAARSRLARPRKESSWATVVASSARL